MTNALAPLFQGPPLEASLDDELRRLIALHGREAVKSATAKLTRAKVGRKRATDWSLLWPIIEMDADDWLAGGNPPQKPRRNYALAKSYASALPGQSEAATHRRIMKELRKRRKLYILIAAERKGRDGAPFAAYIRTLEALAKHYDSELWRAWRDNAELALTNYRELHGEPPADLTFAQIEDGSYPRNELGKILQQIVLTVPSNPLGSSESNQSG